MTCNTITTIDDTYQAIPNQDMKKQYDSAKKIYDIDLGVNITALAAATTLSVFATVCAITGCSKVEVAGAIAAVTVLGISVTGTGIMLGNESDNLNKLKNTNAAIQNTHNDFTKEQINQFRG
jgi:hypothetical protein